MQPTATETSATREAKPNIPRIYAREAQSVPEARDARAGRV
jgi:hypothetical protein